MNHNQRVLSQRSAVKPHTTPTLQLKKCGRHTSALYHPPLTMSHCYLLSCMSCFNSRTPNSRWPASIRSTTLSCQHPWCKGCDCVYWLQKVDTGWTVCDRNSIIPALQLKIIIDSETSFIRTSLSGWNWSDLFILIFLFFFHPDCLHFQDSLWEDWC